MTDPREKQPPNPLPQPQPADVNGPQPALPVYVPFIWEHQRHPGVVPRSTYQPDYVL